MASLFEELIDVLNQENAGYGQLVDLSEDKKDAIIHGKVDVLESITAREQNISSDLKNLENHRTRVLKDMSIVLGKDNEMITVTQMIQLLQNQPAEAAALTKARDELALTASKMQFANQQNEILLQQALEMVEFDLTLFKSLKQAPETANYDKNAYNTGDILGSSGFDTKQ